MNPNESNQSSTIYPLDDLLYSLGFLPISIYICEIILPIVAFIGCILCTLSLWIFFNRKFTATIYWYFRVVTIANLIQLAFAIPYGICFTPKYFPSMNSYSCAIVQCAYIPFGNFTSHFVAILEIAILLERIKIMNPFVKKHFTISPKKMILVTFFACLLFNSIYALAVIPETGGDFFYFDSDGNKRVNTFWFVSTSPLAQSTIGSIVMIVVFFIKDVLTLITTLILNIISWFELKNYIKKRSLLIRRRNAIGPIPFESVNDSTRISDAQSETQYSKKKKNLKLILIMCLISIVERITIVTASVYFLFFTDYISILLYAFADLVYVVGPSISFFVFYQFNRDFKREFLNVVMRFISKFKEISTVTGSLNES